MFEIACGIGYWTQYTAETARSILATDINPEVIEIAKEKKYSKHNVDFKIADIYTSTEFDRLFETAFGGFIWSHIPVNRFCDFLDNIHKRKTKNCQVIFIDNIYVEGSSTPIYERDLEGDTFQKRELENGTEHLVLKNFPTNRQIKELLSDKTVDLEIINLKYYWIHKYEKK